MRDSCSGPFTIIKLTGKKAVEVKLTKNFPGNTQSFHVSGGSPGPVKKIIKARKIRLNGKDQRQYLVSVKNHTADKDKWLEEDDITDGNLHLKRFRPSRRTKQSHQ
ncbi:hypothetical protein O181_039702 [Austropuccinia psidii MF-1]|uniref:Uncharacterized protein n=1 Tax=Austropuccinia psidii MF-1 TaxID=1389203 RepID=A0A9Q3DDE6_9BASI|nr:hypothetical protein [Austropuccinia psidii MF-1]